MILIRLSSIVAALALALRQTISDDTRVDSSKERIYFIKDIYCGENFLDSWTWETMDDPTHGRVNYVDKGTALSANLSFALHDKFVMRVESDRVVSPTARGRDSVRITSHASYGDSVIVLDIAHMPEGCATWPAFWTLSKNGPWPNGGEIDIIEGVSLNTANLASLHTTPECSVDGSRSQSGQAISTNCDTKINSNQGCGTSFTKSNSYGAPFNSAEGGWFAMEKSRVKGIRVWFWSREEQYHVPHTVKEDIGFVYPDTWGLPESDFPITACDHASHFDDHQMVFNTALCGDWAGTVFSAPPIGCGSGTCEDFVNNNPDKFKEAYWEINALRVYTRS